jgi:hypothetical protein
MDITVCETVLDYPRNTPKDRRSFVDNLNQLKKLSIDISISDLPKDPRFHYIILQ